MQSFQYKSVVLPSLAYTFLITDALAPKSDRASVSIMAYLCATCSYRSIVIYKRLSAVSSYLICTFLITDAMPPNGDGTSVSIMAHLCTADLYRSMVIYKCFNIIVPYYLILPFRSNH